MIRPDVPLIVLGGASSAVTSVLHGPIKEQGFGNDYGLVDAVFIGEGEYSIKQFLEVVKKGKALGLSKTEILNACHGKVDGFYEPDKYEHQYKVVVQNPTEIKVTTEKTQSNRDETHGDREFTKNPVPNADREMKIAPRYPVLAKEGKMRGSQTHSMSTRRRGRAKKIHRRMKSFGRNYTKNRMISRKNATVYDLDQVRTMDLVRVV
jgi:radical SAM superfamily enzyme YgiQ (UPF0313 family)